MFAGLRNCSSGGEATCHLVSLRHYGTHVAQGYVETRFNDPPVSFDRLFRHLESRFSGAGGPSVFVVAGALLFLQVARHETCRRRNMCRFYKGRRHIPIEVFGVDCGSRKFPVTVGPTRWHCAVVYYSEYYDPVTLA